MNPLGFVLPLASLGFGAITIKPRRGLFKAGTLVPFVRIPQATIEEVHHDELELTDHPVEQQAAITDHAFKRPPEVIITCAWSNSPSPTSSLTNQATGVAAAALGTAGRAIIGAASTVHSLLLGTNSEQIRDIYFKLLRLQEDRILFDVYTGKRPYNNMLLKSLSVTTSKQTENVLMITAVCRQIIIVQTTKASILPIVTAKTSAGAMVPKITPVMDQGFQQLQNSVPVEVRPFAPQNIVGTPLAP